MQRTGQNWAGLCWMALAGEGRETGGEVEEGRSTGFTAELLRRKATVAPAGIPACALWLVIAMVPRRCSGGAPTQQARPLQNIGLDPNKRSDRLLLANSQK
jgi:hypothetical protein